MFTSVAKYANILKAPFGSRKCDIHFEVWNDTCEIHILTDITYHLKLNEVDAIKPISMSDMNHTLHIKNVIYSICILEAVETATQSTLTMENITISGSVINADSDNTKESNTEMGVVSK